MYVICVNNMQLLDRYKIYTHPLLTLSMYVNSLIIGSITKLESNELRLPGNGLGLLV